MRTLKPLVATLGALALSLVPAPAAPARLLGPLEGAWVLTLHAKTFPMTGEKPYVEKLTADALMTETSSGPTSSLTMVGTLNGAPFSFTGVRAGKHFLLDTNTPLVAVRLSGDAVVPNSTGIAKTLKGRGTLWNALGISDFTFTAKRVP